MPALWLALLASHARVENRLWFVDLELAGACAEVRLDCGADGETRFLGPFAEGEERRARVPVPARSPLGAAGLSTLPLPRALVVPADAGATARVRGWSAEQPAANLESSAGALLARPRPTPGSRPPRASWPELLLVGIAGAFLLRWRARPLHVLALALALAGGALGLARARPAAASVEHVLEWEGGGSLALSIRVARDEHALPRDWLEVVPEGLPLAFQWTSLGTGSVHARGARLEALERVPVPAVEPRANHFGDLVAVWTRPSAGGWSARGAWALGEPLGARRDGPTPDPPGWLASALPPGRPVLLARSAAGPWLRCLGFQVE